MQFRVGPWIYIVRIVHRLVNSDTGERAAGLCDWASHTVYIDAGLPAKARLSVLYHELRHAWQNEVGIPQDAESDANSAASFAADVQRQLAENGGEAALIAMEAEPLAVEPGPGPVAKQTAYQRSECPGCGGGLNLPIATSAPSFDVGLASHVVERTGWCEFCQHYVTWLEAAWASGTPKGQVVTAPEIGRRETVAI